jgi:hypothetical protein
MALWSVKVGRDGHGGGQGFCRRDMIPPNKAGRPRPAAAMPNAEWLLGIFCPRQRMGIEAITKSLLTMRWKQDSVVFVVNVKHP